MISRSRERIRAWKQWQQGLFLITSPETKPSVIGERVTMQDARGHSSWPSCCTASNMYRESLIQGSRARDCIDAAALAAYHYRSLHRAATPQRSPCAPGLVFQRRQQWSALMVESFTADGPSSVSTKRGSIV